MYKYFIEHLAEKENATINSNRNIENIKIIELQKCTIEKKNHIHVGNNNFSTANYPIVPSISIENLEGPTHFRTNTHKGLNRLNPSLVARTPPNFPSFG